MAMRVLGIDGGQSRIRVRHSLDDTVVEMEGVSHGQGDTIDLVAGAVADAWLRLGGPAADRVVLGLSTAPADSTRADRLCRLVAERTQVADVWLSDDSVTAHVGALAGCAGISLVAGTGVACMALPDDGAPRIVGGHGYLLGDEGGGFWIGRRGLSAALRARDGRGRDTALVARAGERYGSLDDVHVRLHDAERPVDAIARFAPDVLDAAAGGDEVSSEIADEAARELVSLVDAANGWLHGDRAPLALGGRLLAPGGGLRRRVEARLHGSTLRLEPRDADGTPLDGAIALGLMRDPGRFRDLVHEWRQEARA